MLALPPAPAAPPRRQLFVGTALVSAAAAMLVGGQLAIWLRFRQSALAVPGGHWLPKGQVINAVPGNVILVAFVPALVFAQWAVYAAKREAKSHTAMALGLVALMGLAMINAQVFLWTTVKLAAKGTAFNSMFFATTGTFLALLIGGIVFSIFTAFRYLGGRTRDREIVSAHALYWYVLSAVFFALWFVVYVTK